ncbi:MAG: hypothetical protein HY000_27455, partial [Planctomycetes bacterium]|nr:hypothetical protein [Planctomycetota bacterium]
MYALGALLYHLLTGSPPFRMSQLEERLRNSPNLNSRLGEYRAAIQTAPPPAGHRKVRGVDRALAEIVNRCLDLDPSRRFPNPQTVLDALDRRARDRERRPLVALGLVAPAVLLVVTITFGIIGWHDAVHQSKESLVRAVQAGNVYAAQGVASTVLLRLQKLRNAVERTSEEKQLRDLLRRRDTEGLHEFLRTTRIHYSQPDNGFAHAHEEPPFESWAVMDRDGSLLARAPRQDDILRRKFDFRDYYKGLFRQAEQAGGESSYISRVFQSAADDRYKFGISALVRDGDEALGIVLATIPTGSTLGSLRLNDEQRTAVLVGRWDTNQQDGTNDPEKNLILIHPAYERGTNAAEVQLPTEDTH